MYHSIVCCDSCLCFTSVPQAILAAIIWVALYGMFTQVMDLKKYYKISLWDVVCIYIHTPVYSISVYVAMM